MNKANNGNIIDEYISRLNYKEFPCIAAKASIGKQQVKCMVADNLACSKDDKDILDFLYDFVDIYRQSNTIYHSAAVIFKAPGIMSEEMFDRMLWQRLQSLADIDAQKYIYDVRVDPSPSSPNFSYSLKEEAFYIIGLHANSSRLSRRFNYPTLVFNPHSQFEALKQKGKYTAMKNAVRKRDILYSGSVNPMLEDFGMHSEVYQYSGIQNNDKWVCPLKINHGKLNNHPTS